MQIRLIKPLKGRVITYEAEIVRREGALVEVAARWAGPEVAVGMLSFGPGDTLYERFYADRWYNVFRIHAADGRLKGWYCNITRPALIGEASLESEDLELDLLVSPDRAHVELLDEDEFAARELERHEPEAHRAALAALADLRARLARGDEPFELR